MLAILQLVPMRQCKSGSATEARREREEGKRRNGAYYRSGNKNAAGSFRKGKGQIMCLPPVDGILSFRAVGYVQVGWRGISP